MSAGLNSRNNYFPNIDILRIIASISIVVLHTFPTLQMVQFNSLGTSTILYLKYHVEILLFGVDLFFVISGYVIATTLEGKKSFTSFLKGRAKRIIPLYWLIMTFTVVLYLIINLFAENKAEIGGPIRIIRSLLFLEGTFNSSEPIVAQGWTLEYEFGFYLIASSLLFMQKMRNSYFFIFSVLIVLGLIFPGKIHFLEFGLGIIVYLLSNKFKMDERFGFVSLFCGFSLLIINFYALQHVNYFIKYGIPSGFILLGSVLIQQIDGKVIRLLGKVSYPLYLVHFLVIQLGFQLVKRVGPLGNLEIVLPFCFTITLSLLLSFVLYLFFDRPITRRLTKSNW